MTGFSNKGGCLPFLAKYNYSESCSFFPMHGMGQTVRGCINLHYLANARCHLETHASNVPSLRTRRSFRAAQKAAPTLVKAHFKLFVPCPLRCFWGDVPAEDDFPHPSFLVVGEIRWLRRMPGCELKRSWCPPHFFRQPESVQ